MRSSAGREGAEQSQLSLAEAIRRVLDDLGAEVFGRPGAFRSYVLDFADADSRKVRVLERCCDVNLLAPYAELASGRIDAMEAAGRAEFYLVHEYVVSEETAKSVSQEIADGVEKWLSSSWRRSSGSADSGWSRSQGAGNREDLTLSAATTFALNADKDAFGNPQKLLGVLLECMSPDSMELRVLSRNLDDELLAIVRPLLAGPLLGAQDCERRIESYLSNMCMVDAKAAQLIGNAIVEGVVSWRKSQDSWREESNSSNSVQGSANGSQWESQWESVLAYGQSARTVVVGGSGSANAGTSWVRESGSANAGTSWVRESDATLQGDSLRQGDASGVTYELDARHGHAANVGSAVFLVNKRKETVDVSVVVAHSGGGESTRVCQNVQPGDKAVVVFEEPVDAIRHVVVERSEGVSPAKRFVWRRDSVDASGVMLARVFNATKTSVQVERIEVVDDNDVVVLSLDIGAGFELDESMTVRCKVKEGRTYNVYVDGVMVPGDHIGMPKTLSLGAYHSAMVRPDGTLWTWGVNSVGQLGDGTSIVRLSPVKIMDDVASVSLCGNYSAAVKTDGTLWTWGHNCNGQLGDGTTTNRLRPVHIMDGVAAVSLGDFHAAAIKTDGSLWTWGYNADGRLGDGTLTSRTAPEEIMSDVFAVALGGEHSAAIKTDGSLWTWGYNADGRLGDGTTTNRLRPVRIMDGVRSISLCADHACAIKFDCSLWTWGQNRNGQLGDGTTEVRRTPIKVMEDVAHASCGAWHTAAVTNAGELRAWGYNGYGQLGDGSTDDRLAPVYITDGVADVALGGFHSAAIMTDGAVWAWGLNMDGQLGNGARKEKHIPGRTRSVVDTSGQSHSR